MKRFSISSLEGTGENTRCDDPAKTLVLKGTSSMSGIHRNLVRLLNLSAVCSAFHCCHYTTTEGIYQAQESCGWGTLRCMFLQANFWWQYNYQHPETSLELFTRAGRPYISWPNHMRKTDLFAQKIKTFSLRCCLQSKSERQQ